MGGDQGEVRVELRRLFVVIARGDLGHVLGLAADDPGYEQHLGMALEFVIVSAMASIKIPVVLEYWAPLLIGSIVILIMMLIWVFWLSPRIFDNCWFEQAIIRYGTFTGVAAVGYMLLRTVDPKMETDAGTIYAFGSPLMSPFVGGGLITTAYPFIISKFGVLNTGLIFIGLVLLIFIILRLFFWNKDYKKIQQ